MTFRRDEKKRLFLRLFNESRGSAEGPHCKSMRVVGFPHGSHIRLVGGFLTWVKFLLGGWEIKICYDFDDFVGFY